MALLLFGGNETFWMHLCTLRIMQLGSLPVYGCVALVPLLKCKFSLAAQKGSTFDHHFSGTLQAVFSFMAYSNAISAPTSRDTPHEKRKAAAAAAAVSPASLLSTPSFVLLPSSLVPSWPQTLVCTASRATGKMLYVGTP